jgi:UDP-N-acetylglucosamine acyltransferase
VIHPTAIVDSRARLGEGVEIGAYSVIGPEVEIGARTRIAEHVVIHGPTKIGVENKIYPFCSLGGPPQDTRYRGEPTRLEIGNRNDIREYCTFNRGTASGVGVTRVGDDNFILAYCHFAHDCQVGNRTVFANGASLAGHVEVGDYAYLGGFTLVHQFCRVGAHCMTGVNSKLYKDVPPFVTVAGDAGAEPHGLNVRGLRRRGFDEATILVLKRAYKTLYRSGLKLADALEELAEVAQTHAHVAAMVEFIRSSKRGIVR